MIVHLDIVVFRLPTVDLPLDLVSVIIEHEEVRVDAATEHCADFLHRLERWSRQHAIYKAGSKQKPTS